MKNLMLKLSQLLTAAVLLLSTATLALAEDDMLSQAELDQMLAPIALYPDTVLTHVLIAATYPLEVVQASRWAKAHPKLTGDNAVRAVEDKNWDPSVKALVAFPQLLERLSSDLDWTEQLGEAFLADETQVLASIQTLRQKAYANGTLSNNDQMVVEREREIIVIEPARKEVVYVPVYDTRVVYGDWWWPSYPPVYWHTAGVYYRNSPFYWGISVNVRPWFYFGIFDWHQRHVVVNHHYYHTPPRYYPKRHKHYVDARRWHHETEHRRGVQYKHKRLNRDYNAGYGYRQPTREIQGAPARHTRLDRDASSREYKQLYQRKTADQVRLTDRERHSTDNSPRQHNETLRQQRSERSVSTAQKVRTTNYNTDEHRQQLKQQLKTPERERQVTTQQRERVQSTEQIRQRTPDRQQALQQRTETRTASQQYRTPQAQPQTRQVQQQTRPVQQPRQEVQRSQPSQATREYRAPTARQTTAQNRERTSRQID